MGHFGDYFMGQMCYSTEGWHTESFLLHTTKLSYLLTTFWCQSDILITSFWLFTAPWSTWPGKHLVPRVAELVGSCILIHAHQCLPDPKCLFYPSDLSLCLSVDQFCLVPVDDMVLFHGMVCDGWLVSYTALPCPGGSGLCTSCKRVHFFLLTSCLSLQYMSWSSSYKAHGRSFRSSPHPWPCPSDELQNSVVFGEDG